MSRPPLSAATDAAVAVAAAIGHHAVAGLLHVDRDLKLLDSSCRDISPRWQQDFTLDFAVLGHRRGVWWESPPVIAASGEEQGPPS